MRRVLLLAVTTTLAACSSQPTTSTAPVAAASYAAVAVPAASSSPSGVAAAAATSSDVVPASGAKAEKSSKIPSGYRVEKRNGMELYCRDITVVGSRFSEKTCFTREQLEELQKKADSSKRDIDQGMKICTGIEGCGLN